MTTKTNVDVTLCDYCCAAELGEAGREKDSEQIYCKELNLHYRGIVLSLNEGHFCDTGCFSAYLTRELLERDKKNHEEEQDDT